MLKENAGLGTEATRAGIITTLENRKLIVRQKKTLRATDTGCQLIDALPAVCTDPGMTALWEQSLEQVAQGNLSLDVFMQKQISWLAHLIKKGGGNAAGAGSATDAILPVVSGKDGLTGEQ